jgi:hypothetical protein
MLYNLFSNGDYAVSTARTVLRKTPLECSAEPDANTTEICRNKILTNQATMEVYFMDFSYMVYSEKPRYPVK